MLYTGHVKYEEGKESNQDRPSSKMTKTGLNTKENLQKQEKASRQSLRCKKTRKSPKSEENQHSIGARCVPSCHDEGMLARQDIRRNKS
ncbi:hypothetical protein QL285_044992 [Trifolium repens]|nr:hypothetical protein QL285_044992 [Trifolium repens]